MFNEIYSVKANVSLVYHQEAALAQLASIAGFLLCFTSFSKQNTEEIPFISQRQSAAPARCSFGPKKLRKTKLFADSAICIHMLTNFTLHANMPPG